jgi:hypothetical protein
MLTIHKYRVATAHGPCAVPMPQGAVILSVGVDFEGHACVWARVDTSPERQKVQRRLFTAHTGDELPREVAEPPGALIAGILGHDVRTFLGTAVTRSGLVLHLFDLGE